MRTKPRDLATFFLSQGHHVFTVDEAAETLASNRGAALDALERLQERREVFSAAKGL